MPLAIPMGMANPIADKTLYLKRNKIRQAYMIQIESGSAVPLAAYKM